MDKVNIFCHCLSKDNFYKLSPDIQKIFYIWAIFCNVHNIGKEKVYKQILHLYKKLLFTLHINGRHELCKQLNINPRQRIQPEMKGRIKTMKIQSYIIKYNVNSSTVFVLDDTPEVSEQSSQIGINGVVITKDNPLEKVLKHIILTKMEYPKSVSMVFIDFDKTLSTSNFRKRWLEKNTIDIVNDHFGGVERINNIYTSLIWLERHGVKLGILSGQTNELISNVLHRLHWI